VSDVLANYHGSLLAVRAPVPATLNRAGVNYKSEVAHLDYSPRRAYDEWLAICEAILACGGDALFDFEDEDEALLDRGDLHVEADGRIVARASGERLGHVDSLQTGRVFCANGPWVRVDGKRMRALLPNLVEHRRGELAYYERLLGRIADAARLELALAQNAHRWEGLADVAPVGERAVLTYTVAGHYDADVGAKTLRSCFEGARAAADFAELREDQRIYAELVYPHFHGDTAQVALRPPGGEPRLAACPAALWGDGAARVARALGCDRLVPIDRDDAVERYAANSRQVGDGVLVPDGVSAAFRDTLAALGLGVREIPLSELFGKAGGGPACATLYLPANLALPASFPLRFSARRAEAHARRTRIAGSLTVDPRWFAGQPRG
jgi:hypothetical protein